MDDHQPSTFDGSNEILNLNDVSFESRAISEPTTDMKVDQKQGRQDVYGENIVMEAKLRDEREKVTQDIAAKFQSTLDDIKITTQKLMAEMEHMMMVNEGVTIDYMKVMESQQHETRRLEDTEPDVMSITTNMQQAIATGNLSKLMSM